MNSIAADTSFYSCFHCHLKDEILLSKFFHYYNFYVGDQLLEEIPQMLINSDTFKSEVNILNYDYSILISPFFERDPKHLNDGEYEAIGLGIYLKNRNELKYLIIDERRAYKFAKKNFPSINPHLRGTLSFIGDCCSIDGCITTSEAISILNDIRSLVETTSTKIRPCSMDKKNYIKLIDPIIKGLGSLE